MRTSVIFARGSNGAFGHENQLCWHLPDDLKRFKALTRGKAILMGRNTWVSLPVQRRPLPDRLNLVLTSNPSFVSVPEKNLYFVRDYHTAERIAEMQGFKDLFLIGGSEIINRYQGHATNAYVTTVPYHGHFDVKAPVLDNSWTCSNIEKLPSHLFQHFTRSL